MAIMFGNGTVTDTTQITKTITFIGSSIPTAWTGPDGSEHTITSPSVYDASGSVVSSGSLAPDGKYFCTFKVGVEGSTIEISAQSFPGTYYVTGDTYARREVDGIDEFFQFIIPKAKVQSENTITLEAEGDPSVFNMNLRVMRPADGVMMKLVKYDVNAGWIAGEGISFGGAPSDNSWLLSLGKTPSDFSDNLSFGLPSPSHEIPVTGQLKYVQNFTAFNEGDPSEQTGYYIPFKVSIPVEKQNTAVVKLIGTGGKTINLIKSEDYVGLVFMGATDAAAQEKAKTFKIEVDLGDGSGKITYTLDASAVTYAPII